MLPSRFRHYRICICLLFGAVFLYLGNTIIKHINLATDLEGPRHNPALSREDIPLYTDGSSNETNVYRWKSGQWIRLPGFCLKARNLPWATLKSKAGWIKMYIHDIYRDIHVSGLIKRTGMWDAGGVKTMESFLSKDPNMGVLDLGSQLGTFSLVAAMMGHHVVAVDPLMDNVLRFCRTVQEGNLTNRVTILFTALSDNHRVVTFHTPKGNVGGTNIVNAKAGVTPNGDFDPKLIETVLLDDIVPFINFQRAFMKIDVENHEYCALKGGRKLVSSIDIRGILMEWFQIKLSPNVGDLKNFLANLSFIPVDLNRLRRLDGINHKIWPNDILWLKR